MILFKACLRCSGDLRETTDIYGCYLSCIQCGHMGDPPGVRFDLTLAGQLGAEDAVA